MYKREEVLLKMNKLGRTLVKETVFREFIASPGTRCKPYIYAHAHTYSERLRPDVLMIKKKENLAKIEKR